MIAQRAGLSPGGVFTTFTDKVAILSHIVAEHRERALGDIEGLIARHDGSARERILHMLDMAFAADFPRMPLVVSYLGATYTWSRGIEIESRRRNARFASMVSGIIKDGVARGEIKPGVDPNQVLMMLYAFYRENCRAAVYDGLDEAGARTRMRQQLDTLFLGLQAQPSCAT